MLNWSLWALLPPIYSAFTAAGLWVVYFVAVQDERIVPLGSIYRRGNGSLYPPYISVAGNFPPASCIFSEVTNLAAFLGFIIAVLRYLQLKPRIEKAWLNVGSLLAFSVSCFGMTLVGNFQLFNELMTHNFGTLLTFGLGTLYCWAQSYITLKVNLKNEGRTAGIIRFLLSGSITTCLIFHVAMAVQHSHLYGTQFQWAAVMLLLVFISTFAIEFRHNRFYAACTDNTGHPVSLTLSDVSGYQLGEQ